MLIATISLLAVAAAAAQDVPPQEDQVNAITVNYAQTKTAAHKPVRETLSQAPQFESLSAAASDVLKLPADLNLHFRTCGPNTQPYDKTNVIVCYQDVAALVPAGETPEERAQDIVAAGIFQSLQRIAQALIDHFGLPADTQDGIDEFAVMIPMLAGDALQPADLEQVAELLLASAAQEKAAIDEIRARRLACLIYGSDPQRLAGLLGPDRIAEEQSGACETQFTETLERWSQSLEGHMRH